MKTCDICGGKIGFFKAFRCQDGVICKNCYRLASNHYATTITQMTLKELKRNYIKNAQPLDMGEDGFRTTRKVGVFLLLDEKNRKFCIPNNQKVTGGNTRPEIFPYDSLKSIQMVSEPKYAPEQLAALAAEKNDSVVIRKLAVRLALADVRTREITVIPSPVRASSFAFRQGLKVAEEIIACLSGI